VLGVQAPCPVFRPLKSPAAAEAVCTFEDVLSFESSTTKSAVITDFRSSKPECGKCIMSCAMAETTTCARACAPVGAIFPSPWDWMPKDTKNVLTRRFVEGAKCLDGSPAGAPRKTRRIAAIMLRSVARRALFGSGTKY
jgi:hypothetical protein